jgi:hypothetical protein
METPLLLPNKTTQAKLAIWAIAALNWDILQCNKPPYLLVHINIKQTLSIIPLPTYPRHLEGSTRPHALGRW